MTFEKLFMNILRNVTFYLDNYNFYIIIYANQNYYIKQQFKLDKI